MPCLLESVDSSNKFVGCSPQRDYPQKLVRTGDLREKMDDHQTEKKIPRSKAPAVGRTIERISGTSDWDIGCLQ